MNLDELFIQGGLYNLNSSESERKQKIEELLKRRQKDEENSREEIPDDEQINRCIARSEVFDFLFRINLKDISKWIKKDMKVRRRYTKTFVFRSKITLRTLEK